MDMFIDPLFFNGPQDISVKEVLPDVWMLGGYMSDNFFLNPPSSNVYILRDQDTLYLVDPGKHSNYKKEILKLADMFKKKGVSRVVLLVTQGHFDHCLNNDVVCEAGIDWKFYLPEDELPAMDAVDDFMMDIGHLGRYEDVFQTMFPGTGICSIFREIAKKSPSLAELMLRLLMTASIGKGNNMADKATILKNAERTTKEFGSVVLQGWQLGRFFLIHDGTHSPGHICIYDPKNKLILSGDTTVEINPAFLYSSMDKLIEITGKYRTMAQEGFIKYAMDAHRSERYMTELFNNMNEKAMDSIQLIEYAKTAEECKAFFNFYNSYYSEMKKEVLAAHSRAGKATVGEIVDELLKSSNKYVKFKAAMEFPKFPSRMDVLVAQVLKEAGADPLKEGEKILFSPVKSGKMAV